VEVPGASLCLTDHRRRLVDVPPVRMLNPAFAAAEAVPFFQIVGHAFGQADSATRSAVKSAFCR